VLFSQTVNANIELDQQITGCIALTFNLNFRCEKHSGRGCYAKCLFPDNSRKGEYLTMTYIGCFTFFASPSKSHNSLDVSLPRRSCEYQAHHAAVLSLYCIIQHCNTSPEVHVKCPHCATNGQRKGFEMQFSFDVRLAAFKSSTTFTANAPQTLSLQNADCSLNADSKFNERISQ
jgi:hypothetical protein